MAPRRGLGAARMYAKRDVTHHLADAIAKWRSLVEPGQRSDEKQRANEKS